MANQTKRLARLIRDADKCAGGATAAVQSAIKDIKGRIALATQELNLAGKAADRDKLFAEIHDRISRLEGELTRYLNAAAEMGSTAGFQAGKDETGLQVKYSAERANAILETVTERNGGELAATFTQNMENEIVGALRTATVEAIRAQAITGGTLKGMSKDLAQRMKDAARDFTFTDSRGRKWDSAAYFQMNTRTNAMRIYNDTLADTIARATGSDLARISGGGDPNCKHCFPWEGRVISLTGKTPGFPTYEDARAAGCFHPNCVHTLEYLDETVDADEIALQKQFPPERDEEGEITADAADENRYEIDIARKMADNPELDATAAKVLVDRDNLAASIRNGAIRADAEKIVAGLTDAQVAALCPDGNPPAFMAAKDNPDKGAEGWNKGSFGGKVYVKGDLTADKLLAVTNTAEAKTVKPIDAATAGAVAKGLKKVDAEAAAQAKAEADAAKQAEAEKKAAAEEKAHAEAVKKAREQAATPLAELTQAQRGAVEWYVSGEGQWVNQYLRGRLDGGISSREKDLIAHIEKATDRELPKDITRLYRSVDLSAIMPNVTDLQFENIQSAIVYGNKDKFAAQGKEAVDKLIGKEFTEKGFMSTTRDKDVALNWGDFTGAEKPIVLQLDNAGKARGIDIVGQKINEQGEKDDPQKEVLLAKGVKYKITGYAVEEGTVIFKCKIENQ